MAHRVSTDPRSGIVNDPNRPDDPKYILRLIGQGHYSFTRDSGDY